MKLRLGAWELLAKINLYGQKRMMFACTKIAILSAVLSHQLLFLREHLDCAEKILKGKHKGTDLEYFLQMYVICNFMFESVET